MNLKKVLQLMKGVGNDLLRWRNSINFQRFEYKKGKEVVSELDKKAEKKIREGVHKLMPDYKIWGEELGQEEGDINKEKFIIIDPIDGTKNYLAGNPLFASQIACVEKGVIKWGIINLPALKEIYLAIAGKGAWCNNKNTRPSKQNSLSLAIQCFGIGHNAQNFIKLPLLIKNQLAEPRHYGCAGVHFAFTANGRTDIYIAIEAAFYDMAAGLLLCKESGLSLCDLNGKPLKLKVREINNQKGLIIANRYLINQFKNRLSLPDFHATNHKNKR
ncbi:MAG: inositol monophosphatase family protein [Candidatus Brennerbacteria bacterium]|nr:inositol monophosphatase family protein [Candidatus Brennerbacteria bacterium]